MICQLPRVDERLLAMMWLLAESWGQVTMSGTLLPLELTHRVLGGLIGARRPTVTLALSELAKRGAVRRQKDGWLLLEAPPVVAGAVEAEAAGSVRPLAPSLAQWSEQAVAPLERLEHDGPPLPTFNRWSTSVISLRKPGG